MSTEEDDKQLIPAQNPTGDARKEVAKATVPEDDNAADDEERRMSFTEHLGELRTRIIRAGIAVAVAAVFCYIFSDTIFAVISRPLTPLQERGILLSEAPDNTDSGIEGGISTAPLTGQAPDQAWLDGLGKGGLNALSTDEKFSMPETSSEQSHLLPLRHQVQIRELSHQVERLSLLNQALWEVLQLRLSISEEELFAMAQAVEARQVTVEEDAAVSVVCGNCHRNVGASDYKCPYCAHLLDEDWMVAAGAEREVEWTILNPLEPIMVKIKLAAYAGLVLAFPFVLFQACAFVFPGLRGNEKKLANILIIGCGSLAVAGVVIAYVGVFPFLMPYLLLFVPEGVQTQLRMNETISIIIRGFVGFAIAFQFPMVVLALVYMDLITPETLKQYRKIAVVLIAFISALLTPPDPISMIIMMAPMVILYEVSILVAKIVVRKKLRAAV